MTHPRMFVFLLFAISPASCMLHRGAAGADGFAPAKAVAEVAFESATKAIENEKYKTEGNKVWLRAATDERSLGFLMSSDNEKWSVWMSFELIVLRGQQPGECFWRIMPFVRGTRDGRKPRIFSVDEFGETRGEFNKVRAAVNKACSGP